MELRKFRLLALMKKSDEEIAFISGMTLFDMAKKAYLDKEFFDAITPTEEEINLYSEKVSSNAVREKRLAYKRKWQKEKRESNPSFKIENAIRARMTAALKGRVKRNSIRDLPYTTNELIDHLSKLFEKGMSMENYGEWHIDHIKPCSMFDHTDREQFLECWSLSNLQPLWRLDNMSKGSKYERT